MASTSCSKGESLNLPGVEHRQYQQTGLFSIPQQVQHFPRSFLAKPFIDNGPELLDQSLEEVGYDTHSSLTSKHIDLTFANVQDLMAGRYVIVFARQMGQQSRHKSYSTLFEHFAPKISRSMVVSAIKSQSELSDVDELSDEYVSAEERNLRLALPGGEINLILGEMLDETLWCDAVATSLTTHDDDGQACTMLDHVLQNCSMKKDHVSFGLQITDTTYKPDYSRDLDSIDEDSTISYYPDYEPSYLKRSRIRTEFGFYFLQVNLSLRIEGGSTTWRIVAVKIEGEEEEDEFGGHSCFWKTRLNRVIVRKDGRVSGPLLGQEIRSVEDLEEA